MSVKIIKNEQWQVKYLVNLISDKKIKKPKFQRKKKWNIKPTKDNDTHPNERNYILFLYETQNSVHPITFGQNNNIYFNIDGNNRINAIIHFLNKPFDIFDEYLNNINKFIDSTFKNNNDIKQQIITIIKNINYNDLMIFKYNKFFEEIGEKKLYNEHLKLIRDDFEPLFDELIETMKLSNKDRFDTGVSINVNIFNEYDTNELCKIFEDINKYNSRLTENELLACSLYNVCEFEISNNRFKAELTENIIQLYEERSQNEVLECFKFNNSQINAYDFMIGFQYYSNKKCKIIPLPDNEATTLFFKLYYIINGENFNTVNVNNFILYIEKTITILNYIYDKIFMENLVSNSKVFDTCNKKFTKLSKNKLYLLMITIISLNKKNVNDSEIISIIEKVLIYDFFVEDIKCIETRNKFKIYDNIKYEAGGGFIDNKAKDLYKNPHVISESITFDRMKELLQILIEENITPGETTKRKNRKFYEKALIYYYYIKCIPIKYLNNKYWIEHIIPFSTKTNDNQIDIDRLGNIIPIIDSINNKRNNKHISEYNKHEKCDFIHFLKDIIPKNEVYDKIVFHDSKNPHMIDANLYNKLCKKNEEILLNNFLFYIFNKN
jgi:hypothetical protein